MAVPFFSSSTVQVSSEEVIEEMTAVMDELRRRVEELEQHLLLNIVIVTISLLCYM